MKIERKNIAAGRMGRGFSLIEVLVSILILGLGLLGLGALFPVVVREQKLASDQVLGIIAANNVRAMLEATATVGPDPFNPKYNPEIPTGWQTLYEPWSPSLVTSATASRPAYLWEPNWDWDSTTTTGTADTYRTTGDLVFPSKNATLANGVAYTPQPLIVPLAARLVTVNGENDNTPQFVWDFAPRINESSRLELAVFIRRIDAGIRVAPGETLRQTLLFKTPRTVLPVGATPPTGDVQTRNRPTLNGTNGKSGTNNLSYSMILEADEELAGLTSTDFGFDTNGDTHWLLNVDIAHSIGQAIAQPGQKLVDNMGNIYTVERIENDPNGTGQKPVRVRINPAPSSSDLVKDTNGKRRLKQFILTPQVPVSVFVTEVAR